MTRQLLANWVGALSMTVDVLIEEAVGEHVGTEMAVLLGCLHFPGATVGELGRMLGLTGSGAVRLIDRCERDGLVVRQPRQGREVRINLSPRGYERAQEFQRHRLTVIEDLLAPLTAEESAQLASMLDKVLYKSKLDGEKAPYACRLCDHECCSGDSCPIGRSAREQREHEHQSLAPGRP